MYKILVYAVFSLHLSSIYIVLDQINLIYFNICYYEKINY